MFVKKYHLKKTTTTKNIQFFIWQTFRVSFFVCVFCSDLVEGLILGQNVHSVSVYSVKSENLTG